MVGETCQGAACVHVLVGPLAGVLWKPRSITVPVVTLVSLLERDWNGQMSRLFSHRQGDMVLGLSPSCLQNQTSRPTPPPPRLVPSGWRQLEFGFICIEPSDVNQRLCIQHISLYAAGVQCRWRRASVTMDFLALKFSQLNFGVSCEMWFVKLCILIQLIWKLAVEILFKCRKQPDILRKILVVAYRFSK